MRVADLREILEEFEDDTEVRIATQHSWPFEYGVSYATAVRQPGPQDPVNQTEILYLATGFQLRYLPDEIKDELEGQGWG